MADEGIMDAGSPGALEGEGAGSAPGSEGQAGNFDWGGFRGTLGDIGKEKSLDPIFAAQNPGEALAKSYVESQKMIGNSIRLPGKDAKPEDRQKAIDSILGKLREGGVLESIPEGPDKYEIALPQTEGFEPNEHLLNGFKETAHKLGIPPSQAQGMFDWYLNYQEEQDRAEQAEFETMKQNLKREFGGLYPRKMEAARRGVARYLGEDGDKIISELPPDVGRKLVLAFSEIGDPLLEDDLVTGGIPGVVTKEAVKAKIDAMMNDKASPLNDLSHRQHKEAVDEYTKLQQQYIRLGGKF
jgi:hypothetical protein